MLNNPTPSQMTSTLPAQSIHRGGLQLVISPRNKHTEGFGEHCEPTFRVQRGLNHGEVVSGLVSSHSSAAARHFMAEFLQRLVSRGVGGRCKNAASKKTATAPATASMIIPSNKSNTTNPSLFVYILPTIKSSLASSRFRRLVSIHR